MWMMIARPFLSIGYDDIVPNTCLILFYSTSVNWIQSINSMWMIAITFFSIGNGNCVPNIYTLLFYSITVN